MMLGQSTTRRSGKFRGGSLLLISSMLFSSAFLRLGAEAGPAISSEKHQNVEPDRSTQEEVSSNFSTPGDMQPLLEEFQKREERIRRQEVKILDRLKALAIAEEAMAQKITEMVQVEEKLRATLSLANGAAESDLTKLTGVYEKMKPKDAAALFGKMDPKFAAGFLSRMKPESAANVLAGLEPESAYTISLIFAGRNVNVPKE